MLDLGSTEFVLAIPSVSERALRQLSSSLFDEWELFADRAVAIPDYSLFLQVEEGSIKGRAAIGATVAALYLGIGTYGDFVSGLKTIGEQVSATGDYLTEQASRVFSCPSAKATSRKRGGSLGALQRLFVRVQKGELTPEEAMVRAETILGDDAGSEPGFVNNLAEALQNCPHYHQHQPLPFFDDESDFGGLNATPTAPRPPRPLVPVLGPPLHLRVEVWRESKSKSKRTRLIKL